MTLGVTALVLLAALMHATWNALIKASRDTSLNTALLAGAASLLSAPLLAFVPAPQAASWPYLIASWVVHQAYFAMVGAAYRHGDLSLTYPLMRGLPPLLVAGAGAFLLPDAASPWLWTGVVTVSVGVLWIGGFQRMLRHAHGRSTAFAAANAVLIAAYTLIDGMGVRLSGNAASYGLWLFFLIAMPYVGIVVSRHRGTIRAQVRLHWWRALLGAALSIGAYLIVLWAMTVAPVAAVAALRETSVIFAAAIGALLLKEPFGRDRVAGACVVVLGIAMLKA
ncbi:MAG: EamA family transporter [Betaproteobacteria bacterium]|nr:MAG: EamA family transporter [Betaproteobacteria bacterium]